ncbi:glycosyltransferase [Algoriphagus antarcticus]|nr:glycosyltransferase [Algoriphagus antarcticus]
MIKPLVSVLMITYNHEAYLKEAINGVLEQEGDFDLELIIAEDTSTDNSKVIINDFIANHPKGNLIKYTRHIENMGMMKNLIWAYNQCNGEFIALCEGDDYWIDKYKIEKQTSFLSANKDFMISYHPAMVLQKNGELVPDFITENFFKSENSNQLDLAIFGNYIHTPTVVFRNTRMEIPAYFKELLVGDFFLYLLLSKNGKINRMPDYSAVYRFQVGFFSSQNAEKIRNDFKKSLRIFYLNYNQFSIKLILFLRFQNSNLFHRNTFIEKSNLSNSLVLKFRYISVIEVLRSFKNFLFRHEYSRVYGKRFIYNILF